MEPRVEVETTRGVEPFRRDKFHHSIALSLRKLRLDELKLGSTGLSLEALRAIPEGALDIITNDRARTAIVDVCRAIDKAQVPTPAVVPSDLLAFAALARIREISGFAYARYSVYHRMFRDVSFDAHSTKESLATLVDTISEQRRPERRGGSSLSTDANRQADVRCPYCGFDQLSIYNTKSPGTNTPLRRYVRCLKCKREAVYVERLNPLFWLEKGGSLQQFDLARLKAAVSAVTAKLFRLTGEAMSESDTYRIARISAEIASREASNYPFSGTRTLLAVSSTRLSQVVAKELRDALPDEPLGYIRHMLYSGWAHESIDKSVNTILKIIDPVAEHYFAKVPSINGKGLSFPTSILERIRLSGDTNPPASSARERKPRTTVKRL